MRKKKFRVAISLFFIFLTSMSRVAALACESNDTTHAMTEVEADEAIEVLSEGVKLGSRIRELLFGEGKNGEQLKLIPGGEIFGVKIKQEHVTVIESKGVPALKCGDVILSINGTEVKSVSDVKTLLGKSGGESVTVRALHG